MPARRPRPVYDWWRDAEATPIPEQCRVEQIAVSKEHGALPSRLHQHGQVVRRGHHRLYLLFDRDDQLTSLRPHLVRVLTTSGGG